MPFDGKSAAPLSARMRELFGPNGEHWGRKRLAAIEGGNNKPGTMRFCLLGAALVASGTRTADDLICRRVSTQDVDSVVPILCAAADRMGSVPRYPAGVEGMYPASRIANFNDNLAFWDSIVRFLDALEEAELARQTVPA